MELLDEAVDMNDPFNPFVIETGFRVNHNSYRNLKLKYKDEEISAKVKFCGENEYLISIDGGKLWKSVKGELIKIDDKIKMKCNIDGRINMIEVFKNEEILALFGEVLVWWCFIR